MVIVRLVGSFVAGALVSGVAAAAIAVYWLEAFDPKYRDAPSTAFEIEMWSLLVVNLVAVVVMGIVGFLFRKRLGASRSTMVLCALWGVAYPLLLRPVVTALENAAGVETLLVPVVAWAYVVLFPALAIVTLLAREPRGKQHAL